MTSITSTTSQMKLRTLRIRLLKEKKKKGKMTDKKVYDCKQHIRNLGTKMNLKFMKNKASDKKIMNDKMCKKIESTSVRPLISFRKTAINELNDFLEKCNK